MWKRVARALPDPWQSYLKKLLYSRQIRKRRFGSAEPEFHLLRELVTPGDWVLDIGANVGHYSFRLSELVGDQGRVFAFEPMRETFSLLTSNVSQFRQRNVTLLNLAASDDNTLVKMEVPSWKGGGRNYYEARIAKGGEAASAYAVRIDSFTFARPIHLVKIDAEGHDLQVLHGMRNLIARDHPIIIVEASSIQITELLEPQGYRCTQDASSPNLLCRPNAQS